MMFVLEEALPGEKFISIKTIDQLEKLTNVQVAAEERVNMQEVLETYPVRLSMHTIRQMRISIPSTMSHISWSGMHSGRRAGLSLNPVLTHLSLIITLQERVTR